MIHVARSLEASKVSFLQKSIIRKQEEGPWAMMSCLCTLYVLQQRKEEKPSSLFPKDLSVRAEDLQRGYLGSAYEDKKLRGRRKSIIMLSQSMHLPLLYTAATTIGANFSLLHMLEKTGFL